MGRGAGRNETKAPEDFTGMGRMSRTVRSSAPKRAAGGWEGGNDNGDGSPLVTKSSYPKKKRLKNESDQKNKSDFSKSMNPKTRVVWRQRWIPLRVVSPENPESRCAALVRCVAGFGMQQ